MLLKFIVFLYFSLYRQREVNKRELVARFESEQITILKNCAAGLASLKQVLALPCLEITMNCRTFADMDIKRIINNSVKIALPLLLGGAILYWMYRDFDFMKVKEVLLHEMNWTWMLLSFPFGILAQMFRGWRWRQTLEPIGEHPRTSTSIHSIFLSYAASLVIPRIGEFTRCGVLKRYDDISFAKSLGTVVTERAIDTLVVVIITGSTLLFQMSMFGTFFERTGTSLESILRNFSPVGYLVTFVCALAVLGLLHILLRKLSFYDKVKTTLKGILEGVVSLRRVRNVPLFIFFTLAIWGSYFLHYYLTFFCFIAVIVPTPNGAGPWHFAVKTMLILYGVADEQALYFVLIVHAIQTLLVILLGIYAWVALAFTSKKTKIT